MRRVEHDLDIPESPGAGAPQRCDTYVEKWVEVSGTFVGDVVVQGQLTVASPWVDVDTATGGVDPTVIEVKTLFWAVRLDTTAVSSGAPEGRLVGLDARTAA